MGNVTPFGGLGRYSGFLAFAALIGGVLLYQSGYWPTSFGSGVRVNDRYIEIREDNRDIRMAVHRTRAQPTATACASTARTSASSASTRRNFCRPAGTSAAAIGPAGAMRTRS